MPYAHFQIPCQGGDGEDALNGFLKRHRVLKVEKHFIAAGGDSFWAYQVQYEQTRKRQPGAPLMRSPDGAEALRAVRA